MKMNRTLVIALMLVGVIITACASLPSAPPIAGPDTTCRIVLKSATAEYVDQFARLVKQDCKVQYVELQVGSINWTSETSKGSFSIVGYSVEDKAVRIVSWENGKAVSDDFYLPGHAVRANTPHDQLPIIMYFVGRRDTDGSYMFLWTGEYFGRSHELTRNIDSAFFHKDHVLQVVYPGECHIVKMGETTQQFSLSEVYMTEKVVKFAEDDPWKTEIGGFYSRNNVKIGMVAHINLGQMVGDGGVTMMMEDNFKGMTDCPK